MIKDGMDIAIVCYDKQQKSLEYAGAKIELLIFRDGKITEYKSDRISIGAGQREKISEKNFQNQQIEIQSDDIVYVFSDGFQDQFGGESDTRFMKSNFRSLLEETAVLNIGIQRSRLLKVLNRWQGNTIQNDDILVAGIKF
jgi:serine phosphatase RsbU (regulator of sigma subunit)